MRPEVVTTILLALVNAAFVIFAFFIFRRPLISLLNLFGFGTLINFTVRPILSASHDYFLLYLSSGEPSAVNTALLAHLLALCSFYIGYWVGRPKTLFKTFKPKPKPMEGSFRVFLLSLTLGSLSFVIMLLLAGRGLLSVHRQTAVTLVIPGGKYFFGLIEVPLSLTFMLGFLAWQGANRLRKMLIWFGCLLATVVIAVAYQRGFLLFALLCLLFAFEKMNALNRRLLILAVIGGFSVVFWMRPLVDAVISFLERGSFYFYPGTSLQDVLLSKMLYSPNFDGIDVLVVGLRYLETQGPTGGFNILGWFLRPLPFQLRTSFYLSGTDILNLYVWGDFYRLTGFGFNVGFPVEMLISFGWLGLILCALPGWISGLADRWIAKAPPSPLNMIVAASLLYTGGFMGPIDGVFQWLIAYLAIGFAIVWLSSVRITISTHNLGVNKRVL